MADGGFTFLLESILYPMTLEYINFVISINLFRWLHIETYQRRSPIPHKRDRDRVPLCNNGTDLLVRRLVGRSTRPLGGKRPEHESLNDGNNSSWWDHSNCNSVAESLGRIFSTEP